MFSSRHRRSQFYVKVVRSPDGESRGFTVGEMSVQRAASWVLDKYYTEFPIYNPFLDRILSSGSAARSRGNGGKEVKIYDVDGHGGNINVRRKQSIQ